MKRFVLAAVVGSLRRALAVVIALVALSGAIYFGSHKLSNPDHYHALISDGGPGCVYPGPVRAIHPPISSTLLAADPSRLADPARRAARGSRLGSRARECERASQASPFAGAVGLDKQSPSVHNAAALFERRGARGLLFIYRGL